MSPIDPMLLFLVRYLHPQRLLPPFPGVNAQLAATILGAPQAMYEEARSYWDGMRDKAVDGLLNDSTFTEAIDKLSFAASSTVVGFGDSLTDDCCSWFELLTAAVTRRRPGDSIRFVNAGVAGESSAQMLSRIPFVASLDAQTIICFAGGNDARRFAATMEGTQASTSETIRNLKLAHDVLVQNNKTKWIWMTPIGIDDSRASASRFWASQGTLWRGEDVMAVADRIAEFPGEVVDLRHLFGAPMDGELISDDGLHPTVTGQTVILTALVLHLVGNKDRRVQ